MKSIIMNSKLQVEIHVICHMLHLKKCYLAEYAGVVLHMEFLPVM